MVVNSIYEIFTNSTVKDPSIYLNKDVTFTLKLNGVPLCMHLKKKSFFGWEMQSSSKNDFRGIPKELKNEIFTFVAKFGEKLDSHDVCVYGEFCDLTEQKFTWHPYAFHNFSEADSKIEYLTSDVHSVFSEILKHPVNIKVDNFSKFITENNCKIAVPPIIFHGKLGIGIKSEYVLRIMNSITDIPIFDGIFIAYEEYDVVFKWMTSDLAKYMKFHVDDNFAFDSEIKSKVDKFLENEMKNMACINVVKLENRVHICKVLAHKICMIEFKGDTTLMNRIHTIVHNIIMSMEYIC
jgi:hypothetical protein